MTMNASTIPPNGSHHLLVPTDFSVGAEKAFLHALSLAHQENAVIHLLHVVTRPDAGTSIPGFPDLEAYTRHQEAVAMHHLRTLSEATQRSGLQAHIHVRISDNVTACILDYADRHQITLTLMGTHAHQSGTLGKTVDQVVRRARGSVFTVSPTVDVMPGFLRHVLVPIDFSGPSFHALRLADEMAMYQNAKLTLLHVIEPHQQAFFYEGHVTELATRKSMTVQEAHQALRRFHAEMQGRSDNVVTSVVEGMPGEKIAQLAANLSAHLIVQGAHGHTDIDHLELGQVADTVLRTAPCPVITVKGSAAQMN